MTSACAWARLSARPRSTSSMSRRFFTRRGGRAGLRRAPRTRAAPRSCARAPGSSGISPAARCRPPTASAPRRRERRCRAACSPSALDTAENQPPRVERDLATVEVAPRAGRVEARGLEHRDQLVRRVDAQRVADRLAVAVASYECPVGETARALEVELAALDHERARAELLPVHLLEATSEREQVDRVDEERAARAERACHRFYDAPVVGFVVEVADHAREQVDRRVELAVEVKLAGVAFDECRVETIVGRGLARELDRARAEIDSGDTEAAPREVDAVPSVATRDVEHTRARLELEALEHEVDLLARPLLGDVQRDLVEPLLLEVAVEPVARNIAQTVRTARSSTIPLSTDVSASTRSSALRARSAASSASRRALSRPSAATKPSPSRMSSTTWKSMPSSSAKARHGRCSAR